MLADALSRIGGDLTPRPESLRHARMEILRPRGPSYRICLNSLKDVVRVGGKTNVCKVSRGVPVEQERMVECPHVLDFLACCVWAANVIVQVNCVAMFSRYPRSVLRHELDHNGRNTLSTLMLKPIRSRSNNEGMGSPTAASRLVEVVPNACGGQEDAVVQETTKTRVLRGRFLKGFTSRELRERLSQQRVGRKKCPVFHQPVTKATVITSCGDWEFPPARSTAPGRKVYRRGSVRGVRSFCDNPVGIAKA